MNEFLVYEHLLCEFVVFSGIQKNIVNFHSQFGYIWEKIMVYIKIQSQC